MAHHEKSMQDAKQASKNGMPLSPGAKQPHPRPHGKHHGRKSSRKS